MKVSKFAWVLGISSGFSCLVVAPAARADHCKVYPDVNIPQGNGAVTYLPTDVTATSATGSPNNSSWANSSSRVLGSRLTQIGMNNNISSVEVNAVDSDVSLYLMDGENFDGNGWVMFCKKGFSCWINLPSSINNKTSSFICQREFFRMSYFIMPDGRIVDYASNPVLPMAAFSKAVDDKVTELIGSSSEIDNLRHTSSSDGYSLWSRTAWMTKPEHCKMFNKTCTDADRYVDYMRISKRFEIDLDLPIEIGPTDDDYVIQVDWYLRPVLADWDFQLRFWWANTHTWIEGGTFTDDVADVVLPKVQAFDIQTELRNGVVKAATDAGCGWCIDNKRRLQMSFFETADVAGTSFVRNFNMFSTPAKIVLTTNREANYLQ